VYAGKVERVAKEDMEAFLKVWYPAEEKGREMVINFQGLIKDPTYQETVSRYWSAGSLIAVAVGLLPDGSYNPYYVKDLVSGKDKYLEQIDLKDYIPGMLTESVYYNHPTGVHAKGEVKNLSSEIEEAIRPIKPSKTLVESLMAGETPKELGRVRGTELDEQLCEAARKGDYVWVRLLIAQGADVNAKVSTLATYMGSLVAFETPLMAAVSGKVNMEVIQWLVEKGADPALEREIMSDEGISDVRLEGTGKYESAIDLARGAQVKEYLMTATQSRPRPKIQLSRSFSADTVCEGEEFEVKIVAENIGNDVARDVVIQDEIPDRHYWERPDLSTHYEITKGTPHWKGSIPPGGKKELNYTIRLFEKIFDWEWKATCFYSGKAGEYVRRSEPGSIWFRKREEVDKEAREKLILSRARQGDEEAQQEFIKGLHASSGQERSDYLGYCEDIHQKWLLKGLDPLLEDKQELWLVDLVDIEAHPGAPEVLRVCDIVLNLIASISGATSSFPVNEWTNYSDAQLAEVRAFLQSLDQ
jgi:hypothetical protein